MLGRMHLLISIFNILMYFIIIYVKKKVLHDCTHINKRDKIHGKKKILNVSQSLNQKG